MYSIEYILYTVHYTVRQCPGMHYAQYTCTTTVLVQKYSSLHYVNLSVITINQLFAHFIRILVLIWV